MRRLVTGLCILLMVLHVPTPVAGQPAAVFDRLAGVWRGGGTLMGRDARFDLRWERHADLAILTFENAFVDARGEATRVLAAGALYRTSPAMPEAVWLDSRGVRIEIAWTATDSTLVAEWTAPDEAGRTTYRVVAPDSLEVVDEVRMDGGFRTFATASYRRMREPARE